MYRARRMLLLASVLALASPPLGAEELSSASFRLRGPSLSASASSALESAATPSAFGVLGASVGQSSPSGPSGSETGLASTFSGFWPIAAGGFVHLDSDGDGVPAFLDPDDDGDGLADEVETNTGIFVSASNTGTDPLDPDSDGDGFSDGVEIAAGSDPNQPLSTPPPIPALPIWAWLLLSAGLAGTARWQHRARERSG